MQLLFKGVKHALDVCFNMIFMHLLYDKYFGYAKWKLTNGDLVMAREEKSFKLN